jgi:hypothetical protein
MNWRTQISPWSSRLYSRNNTNALLSLAFLREQGRNRNLWENTATSYQHIFRLWEIYSYISSLHPISYELRLIRRNPRQISSFHVRFCTFEFWTLLYLLYVQVMDKLMILSTPATLNTPFILRAGFTFVGTIISNNKSKLRQFLFYFLISHHSFTHSLTHGAEPFLRSCQLCCYSRTSQHFMEPGGSSPRSHKPSTGHYPEPDGSNPYHNNNNNNIAIYSLPLTYDMIEISKFYIPY